MSADRLKELVADGVLNADATFSAPWEARAFAIAVGLCDRGWCEWEDFRRHLINEIRVGDRNISATGQSAAQPYYEHFLRALERLLADKSIVMPQELVRRIDELNDPKAI
ncbi:MAG: nitrile hydratase accessory protein [Candidatus Binataceae bacterium]